MIKWEYYSIMRTNHQAAVSILKIGSKCMLEQENKQKYTAADNYFSNCILF